jgi:hypothetical protein
LLDLILGWAVIFLPFVLAVVFIFIPARDEDPESHMRWRLGLVLFGAGFGLLAWWQQHRALKSAGEEREIAIYKDFSAGSG